MKVPHHIAIIMDGNGRWAQARGYNRIRGHREGAKRVDEIVTECAKLGVRYLTLYTFSTENWSRPKREVNLLMRLLVENLRIMDKKLLKNRIRLHAQGTLESLPYFVRTELERVLRLTRFDEPKMTLNLALSYGGRREIVEAAKEIAKAVADGELTLDRIDETCFRSHLYSPHIPDPDLLIRTGGDYRVSNFLLWQIAYSEILVCQKPWPEFTPIVLGQAIEEYGKRQRRFGKTPEQVRSESSLDSAFLSPEIFL